MTPNSSPAKIAALLLTLGCAPVLPAPRLAPQLSPMPLFQPDRAFLGTSRGDGTLVTRGKPPLRYTVRNVGAPESESVFRLDQTVTFASGAVESRTWKIRRLDNQHFSATLTDAAGKVSADAAGNLFHLRYLVRKPWIYMEQWLYLQPDGTILNIGRVKLLGIVLARLSETITPTR